MDKQPKSITSQQVEDAIVDAYKDALKGMSATDRRKAKDKKKVKDKKKGGGAVRQGRGMGAALRGGGAVTRS